MAMNGNTLGQELTQAILADLYDGGGDLSSAQIAGVEKISAIIAEKVVAHIQANAVVTVAAGIGVSTTGSASAQTGATDETGTGTIT
jgi:GTP cyclohydrolase III